MCACGAALHASYGQDTMTQVSPGSQYCAAFVFAYAVFTAEAPQRGSLQRNFSLEPCGCHAKAVGSFCRHQQRQLAYDCVAPDRQRAGL